MKSTALYLITALMVLGPLSQYSAGQAVIHGSVVAENQPIPFASVGVKGTTIGSAADLNGLYTIAPLSPASYTIVASAVGYQTSEVEIELVTDDTLRIDFELDELIIQSDGITVTGTLVETFTKESPVKVDVVTPSYLEKIPTANIMEALENVNGLYQQIDCAVCGTNNIRINGMDGPYTAVLIDGTPIMSSLATVYGLNGMSPSLIQQVEVIKGPMSTLYGSEAMGGVINIITKKPANAPSFSFNTFGTSDGEYALDLGLVPTRGRFASLLSATFFHNGRFLDENGDNFADLVLTTRASIFGKASLSGRDGFRRVEVSGRYYYEDRLGGTSEYVSSFSDDLRGSDSVYGETIRTKRLELVGTIYLDAGRGAKIDGAFNLHDQDSFYGPDSYQARQSTGFSQFLWPLRLDATNALSLGVAARVQSYDDNTGATARYDSTQSRLDNQPDKRLIPGVFVQHEWIANGAARFLTGLRLDYQEGFGIIPSPRVSAKVSPTDNTTIRLNAGTGFRIVNLFTEDHAAYTGSRVTVVMEDLDPERSVNGTIGIQQTVPFGIDPMNIDLEGFYTRFSNKIEPDYGTPGLIVYRNLAGSATTRGISLTISQSMSSFPVSYTVGWTWLDVFLERERTKEELEFAPNYQGVLNLTYRLPGAMSIDYTANLTGPMKLPEYEPPFQREPHSPTFAVHNIQITKDLDVGRSLLQVYVAAENVLGYRQPSPLVDPGRPFGPNFDTAYVYGPIHGRCLGVGVRLISR